MSTVQSPTICAVCEVSDAVTSCYECSKPICDDCTKRLEDIGEICINCPDIPPKCDDNHNSNKRVRMEYSNDNNNNNFSIEHQSVTNNLRSKRRKATSRTVIKGKRHIEKEQKQKKKQQESDDYNNQKQQEEKDAFNQISTNILSETIKIDDKDVQFILKAIPYALEFKNKLIQENQQLLLMNFGLKNQAVHLNNIANEGGKAQKTVDIVHEALVKVKHKENETPLAECLKIGLTFLAPETLKFMNDEGQISIMGDVPSESSFVETNCNSETQNEIHECLFNLLIGRNTVSVAAKDGCMSELKKKQTSLRNTFRAPVKDVAQSINVQNIQVTNESDYMTKATTHIRNTIKQRLKIKKNATDFQALMKEQQQRRTAILTLSQLPRQKQMWVKKNSQNMEQDDYDVNQ